MPSPPPLSPTPRRADNSEFSALLSSWGSNDERRGFPSWRSSVQRAGGHNDSEEEREVDDFLTAPDSSQKGNNTTPQIRTTSPSPRRPGAADSPAASLRSSEGRLSPLMPPPSRGQLFSETPTPTFARSGLTKPHGTMTGSRGFRGLLTQTAADAQLKTRGQVILIRLPPRTPVNPPRPSTALTRASSPRSTSSPIPPHLLLLAAIPARRSIPL
jgi:hypothetical protein